MYPRLRERHIEANPSPTGLTYAQVAQTHTDQPHTNIPPQHSTNTTHPANDLTELKLMMKNLLNQMGTLINLVTVLIGKNN